MIAFRCEMRCNSNDEQSLKSEYGPLFTTLPMTMLAGSFVFKKRKLGSLCKSKMTA